MDSIASTRILILLLIAGTEIKITMTIKIKMRFQPTCRLPGQYPLA